MLSAVNENKHPYDSLGTSGKKRRQYPRIHLNRPIPARLPDGSVHDDLVQNVSVGGLRLRCDRQIAIVIHPDGKDFDPENAETLDLQITLPVEGKDRVIMIECRVCYVKDNPDGTMGIGVQFAEFKEDTLEHFSRFVMESLMPSHEVTGE